MGRFKLDSEGIKKIRSMMERQIAETKKLFATEAYEWLIDFGYHATNPSGPNMEEHGWSFYTAANWNCSINGIDSSMLSPERKKSFTLFKDETTGAKLYEDSIDYEKAKNVFSSAKFSDTLTVTQTSYYIEWLNKGGTLQDTNQVKSNPNRFIELCQAHLSESANEIISFVVKSCPNL